MGDLGQCFVDLQAIVIMNRKVAKTRETWKPKRRVRYSINNLLKKMEKMNQIMMTTMHTSRLMMRFQRWKKVKVHLLLMKVVSAEYHLFIQQFPTLWQYKHRLGPFLFQKTH